MKSVAPQNEATRSVHCIPNHLSSQVDEIQLWARTPIWWWRAIALEPKHCFNAIGVALILSRRRDHSTNQCFPGHDTIGHELGIGRKRVGEAIAVLERAGIVTSVRRARKSKVYTIHLIPVADASLEATATGASLSDDVTATVHDDVTATGRDDVTGGCSVSPSVSPSANSHDDVVAECRTKADRDARLRGDLKAFGCTGAQIECGLQNPDLAQQWLDADLSWATNKRAALNAGLRDGVAPFRPKGSVSEADRAEVRKFRERKAQGPRYVDLTGEAS